MKTLIAIILCALALAGCATTDYEQYAKSAEAASVARSQALAQIAQSGDSSAKVAAVMALALGAGGPQLHAPQASQALQWAQVLVPSVTQIAGMRYNYLSQQAASNTAARVAESTNATMLGIAGKIQAPAAPQANVSTVTTSTDNHAVDSHDATTLSGTGTLGSGAYSTADRHDSTTTTPAPVITPVVQITPLVVVPDTVINQPVVVPDTIQITPVFAPVP